MKPARKTALTFEERITAAHLHYVQGVDQHVIAFAYGVNPGRVAEACIAIRLAACDPKGSRELIDNVAAAANGGGVAME
jgi:hypothetical protein